MCVCAHWARHWILYAGLFSKQVASLGGVCCLQCHLLQVPEEFVYDPRDTCVRLLLPTRELRDDEGVCVAECACGVTMELSSVVSPSQELSAELAAMSLAAPHALGDGGDGDGIGAVEDPADTTLAAAAASVSVCWACHYPNSSLCSQRHPLCD